VTKALGGKDLRRAPLEERKLELAKLLREAGWALAVMKCQSACRWLSRMGGLP
jgi:ATP-dependent DNA ligase